MGSGLISVEDRTLMTDTADPLTVEDDLRIINIMLWRERRRIDVSIRNGERVMDILKRVGSSIDGTLVFDGDTPLPLDEEIIGSPELKIISVASGG